MMWGLAAMAALNEKAVQDSRLCRLKPLRLVSGLQLWPPAEGKIVPQLGESEEHMDRQHKRLDTLFLDTLGFGGEDEPALITQQVNDRLAALAVEHGDLLVALTTRGQFQAYMGVWKQVWMNGRRPARSPR